MPPPVPFALPTPAPQLSRLSGPIPSVPMAVAADAASTVPPDRPKPAAGDAAAGTATRQADAAGADAPKPGGVVTSADVTSADVTSADVTGGDVTGGNVTGPARLDRRGERIMAQLRQGDIAVIDMIDIDLDTARALIARRPSAVLNASSSTTGRVPGMGPVELHRAGVRLIDDLGSALLALVDNGDVITVTHDGKVMRGGRQLAAGKAHDAASVAGAARKGRAGLTAQLAAFGACLPVVFEEERHLLLSPAPVEMSVAHTVEQFPPLLATLLREGNRRARRRSGKIGRGPAVVVLGGPRAREDVRSIARFARGSGALVIAVAEGARAAMSGGLRPDVIIGEGRELSEELLGRGAAVVHLAGPRSSDADVTEARSRLRRLGVPHALWRTGLHHDDAAIVLSVSLNTAVVVLAGDRRGVLEFAEQKALGMAGTSLTRAAWGHRLVDAATARRLLRPPMRWVQASTLIVLGTASLAGALSVVGSGADVVAVISAAAATVADLVGLDGLVGARP